MLELTEIPLSDVNDWMYWRINKEENKEEEEEGEEEEGEGGRREEEEGKEGSPVMFHWVRG